MAASKFDEKGRLIIGRLYVWEILGLSERVFSALEWDEELPPSADVQLLGAARDELARIERELP
jgi:hypothetical protein